jgi:hypothetical protein
LHDKSSGFMRTEQSVLQVAGTAIVDGEHFDQAFMRGGMNNANDPISGMWLISPLADSDVFANAGQNR